MLALVTTKHKVLEVKIFNFKLIHVYSHPQSHRFLFGHVVGETEDSYYENLRRVALGTRIGFMYKSKVNSTELLGKLTENQYQRHLLIMYTFSNNVLLAWCKKRVLAQELFM